MASLPMPNNTLRTALILFFSTALVVLVTWFAPGLSAGALNLLFRLRGPLPAPSDVVILAIDDQSLRRVGQWPWPRTVMATALDRLTAAHARAIGLDIIYAEASKEMDDRQLAEALARNGRVVLPAQLYETESGQTTAWLRPLPLFADAARALGHAHVAPGVDGMARSLQLSKADDRAQRLWAFGLEVVRVAEQISPEDWRESGGELRVGAHRIPVTDPATHVATPGITFIRPNEMLINYAGPARSFQQYSFADLLEDKLPPAVFSNKLVLIGAVASSLGDSRVVPFMHTNAQQGGQEMPGVEIHANIINSLRNQTALRGLPEWQNFAAAVLVMLACILTVRSLAGWWQLALLGLILLGVCTGSYLAFSRWQVASPLVPMLTGFAVVLPLLLNRALAASRELDLKLAALVESQRGFASGKTLAFAPQEQTRALPQSLSTKLRAVDDLTRQLLARMSFNQRILSSMGEGVLVTDLRGRIVFANREAQTLFGCRASALQGAYFEEFLQARGKVNARAAIIAVLDGQSTQLEFACNARHCTLLLSPLTADPDTANIIGIVALLADITRRVELDRMKTETLQLVSHELRTPLTSIQGLSEVLLKFPVAQAESRELLGTIHAEALRLSETINRYLDLTRLESGAQPLRLAAVDCAQLLTECARQIAVLAADRAITLRVEVASGLPALQADAQLLAQAVSNLLSNALKYSPPHTTVVASAVAESNGIALSVQDQGFGIPAEAHERIFEKFYRLERDNDANVVGTGLGLALVKEIVERHGGRVTFESKVGSGSTFTLHLPWPENESSNLVA